MATLVAWNLSIGRTKADVIVNGVSYFLKCTGDPHSDPSPTPVTLQFPGGDLVLTLSATEVGPHKDDEADSFSFRGTTIKARITCGAGALQSGGNMSEQWDSGTHTMWLDSSAVTQHNAATPTPDQQLAGSYTMPLGGILSVCWQISTEVKQDLLYIKSTAFSAYYYYYSGTGPDDKLTIIMADPKTIKASGWVTDQDAHITVFATDAPTIRSKWRTGKRSRR